MFTRNARTRLSSRQWSQSLLASEEKQSILQTPRLLQSVPSALVPFFPFVVRQLKPFATPDVFGIPHAGLLPGTLDSQAPRLTTEKTGPQNILFGVTWTILKCQWYGWQGFGTIFDLTHQLAFLVTKFVMFSGDHDALSRQEERYYRPATDLQKTHLSLMHRETLISTTGISDCY